jgi:four helix bundle protein
MTRFDALEVAIELVAAVQPLIALIAKHDPNHARQLREACDSIPANLAEGSGRLGKDARYHYSVACGSARETKLHLRLAVAKRYVAADEAAAALGLADRECALTTGLIRKK